MTVGYRPQQNHRVIGGQEQGDSIQWEHFMGDAVSEVDLKAGKMEGEGVSRKME